MFLLFLWNDFMKYKLELVEVDLTDRNNIIIYYHLTIESDEDESNNPTLLLSRYGFDGLHVFTDYFIDEEKTDGKLKRYEILEEAINSLDTPFKLSQAWSDSNEEVGTYIGLGFILSENVNINSGEIDKNILKCLEQQNLALPLYS
jgi:hypothetical protein